MNVRCELEKKEGREEEIREKKKDGFLGKFPEQVMLVAMQQIRISRVKVTKVRG